jgi:hypothetical protein
MRECRQQQRPSENRSSNDGTSHLEEGCHAAERWVTWILIRSAERENLEVALEPVLLAVGMPVATLFT